MLDHSVLPGERLSFAASAGVRDLYGPSVNPGTCLRRARLCSDRVIVDESPLCGRRCEALVTVFLRHAFVNTSLVCTVGVVITRGARVTSFGWWLSRGLPRTHHQSSVVCRKGHRVRALQCCFLSFFLSLSLSSHLCILFCPTTPLQLSEKRHRPTFTLHQRRGLFPTTDSYRAQRREEKFVDHFWAFFFSLLLRIFIWLACVLLIPSSEYVCSFPRSPHQPTNTGRWIDHQPCSLLVRSL